MGRGRIRTRADRTQSIPPRCRLVGSPPHLADHVLTRAHGPVTVQGSGDTRSRVP